MAVVTRDFDTMVQAILNRIVAADVGITDTSKGSVVRTIVESIVSELDIQYYQIEGVYNSYNVDTATGEDLDGVIAILGVTRVDAIKATGIVRFARSTPAVDDILISTGTVISTSQDINGDVIEFITTADGTIASGQTYVDIAIEAVVAGAIYVGANKLVIMSTPVVGVDTVTNSSAINGGSDAESDASLRDRAKRKLAQLGKGTASALYSAIMDVEGITDVSVLDQNRGLATVDIIVVAEDMPPSQTILDDVNEAIDNTKSAGIDVDIIYPDIVNVNVTVTISGITNPDEDVIGNAIIEYFETIVLLGETFIVKQMERRVLAALDTDGADIVTTLPSANVTVDPDELIRYGTITINSVEWTPS